MQGLGVQGLDFIILGVWVWGSIVDDVGARV